MNKLEYTIKVEDIYRKSITNEDLKSTGYEIVGFYPPTFGEIFYGDNYEVVSTCNFQYSYCQPRLILRKIKQKINTEKITAEVKISTIYGVPELEIPRDYKFKSFGYPKKGDTYIGLNFEVLFANSELPDRVRVIIEKCTN